MTGCVAGNRDGTVFCAVSVALFDVGLLFSLVINVVEGNRSFSFRESFGAGNNSFFFVRLNTVKLTRTHLLTARTIVQKEKMRATGSTQKKKPLSDNHLLLLSLGSSAKNIFPKMDIRLFFLAFGSRRMC